MNSLFLRNLKAKIYFLIFNNERKSMKVEKQISKEKLEELINQNFSLTEIAENLNISKKRIQYLLRKMNIKVDFRKKRNASCEKTILEEYKKVPSSITEISKRLGIQYITVRKVFKKYNLENVYSPKAKYFLVLNKDSYSEILNELKNSNKSLAKIGTEHGVSRQWVHQIQKKNKIIRP